MVLQHDCWRDRKKLLLMGFGLALEQIKIATINVDVVLIHS